MLIAFLQRTVFQFTDHHVSFPWNYFCLVSETEHGEREGPSPAAVGGGGL
jgi:hypothetical protein